MDEAHMEQQRRPRAPSTKPSERFLGDSKLETEGKAERRKVRSGTTVGGLNGQLAKKVNGVRRRPVQPKATSAPKA